MSPSNEPQKPPETLQKAGKTLWKAVVSDFALEDRQLKTLELACQQVDRAAAARLLIKRDGVVVLDRFKQQKPHPAVDVERNAALAASRLMRELGLDYTEPSAPRGPHAKGTR